MKKNNLTKTHLFFLMLIFITTGFVFRLTLFKNLVPFPSRALVAKYYPWNTMSGFGVPFKDSDFTDAFRQQFPWKHFFLTGVEQGKLNLWNPRAFSGYPMFANLQSAYFTPFNLIYFLFGLINGWTINIILMMLLSGIFMYLFLQTLKFKPYLCFLGSLGFMFLNYIIHWLEWTVVSQSAIWLPLCLYALEKVFLQKKYKYFLIYVLAIAFSLLGGRIQSSVYVIGFSWLYFFLRVKKQRAKSLLFLSVFTVVAFLLAAVQLVPSFELYQQTPRGDLASRLLSFELLMPIKYLITIFIPDFFGNPGAGNYWGEQFAFRAYFGISFLFFYFYALFFHKRKLVKNLKILNLLFLFLALENPLTKNLPYFNIPILSSSDPSRILFLYEFSAVLISLFGVELFFKKKEKLTVILKSQIIPLVVFVAVLLYLLPISPLSLGEDFKLQIAFRNSLLPLFIYVTVLGAALFYLKFPKLKKFFIALVIFLATFEFSYFISKYIPFGEKKFIFPHTIHIEALQAITGKNRFVCTPGARLEKNFATYFSLYSPEGYDSLSLKRYGQLVAYIRQGNEVFVKTPRVDADVIYYQEDKNNLKFKRLLDLLSIKYILGWAGEVPYLDTPWEPEFESVWDWQFSHLYEYKNSLSRFRLVNEFEVISQDEEILARLFSSEFEPREKIILEQDPELKLGKDKQLEYSIDVLVDEPDAILLKVNSNQEALLLVSDNFYPGWSVFQGSSQDFKNGIEKKIYRSNYNFKAVVVSEGESFLRFTYQPLSFKVGKSLSMMGFLSLIYLIMVPIFKDNEDKKR